MLDRPRKFIYPLMADLHKTHIQIQFGNILKEAITEIIKVPYRRCAVYTSASRVANLWIEIEEDDIQTAKQLLILQSQLNVAYNSKGISIVFDIFEPSEEAAIPTNFKVLPVFAGA